MALALHWSSRLLGMDLPNFQFESERRNEIRTNQTPGVSKSGSSGLNRAGTVSAAEEGVSLPRAIP